MLTTHNLLVHCIGLMILLNTARLTSNRSKRLLLNLQSQLSNVKLRRLPIPSRWAWQLPKMLRSLLTRQRPPIMSVFPLVPLTSRWTRLSRNSVRSSDLSHVEVLVALLLVLPLPVVHQVLLALPLEVMVVQRPPLLRLLLPRSVQRLTLILLNRNVRLPRKSRELLRLPRIASMPRRRELTMRARRPTKQRSRLRQTRMLP